jgi:hypothetical protein
MSIKRVVTICGLEVEAKGFLSQPPCPGKAQKTLGEGGEKKWVSLHPKNHKAGTLWPEGWDDAHSKVNLPLKPNLFNYGRRLNP